MRIVYYTHTAFFETALSLVSELSHRAEVHLLVEVGPDAWNTASFDVPPCPLPSGLVPADEVLRDVFPAEVREYWRRTASFHLVVHNERRSLHPTSWRVSRQVIRFVESLRPAVFHVDDVDVSTRLALALPYLRRTPLVLNVHDPAPHSGEHNWRKDLSRWSAYRKATRFVLHNRQQKEPFCRRYRIVSEAVQVVRLGAYDIFRAWADPQTQEEPNSILFFGRISPYKGLDVLYEALPRVVQQVPGVRLIVAGKPISGYTPPRPPSVPGPAQVQVLSRYLSNATVAQLIQRASLVVCPYRDATQSGVVLTAYAFHKPVVASDVGGLSEYILNERTGVLVPPGDPDALADALCRVLTIPALRRSLGQGVVRLTETTLSWARAAEETLSVYEQVKKI